MYFSISQEKGSVNKMKRSFYAYKGMTLRNIKVYLKDRMSIVLSMLTQIIVLGLYLLFLKGNYVEMIKSSLEGLEELITDRDIEALINSWLVAGVIGTSVVTVALNSLSVMVSDKQNKISFDYGASPVKGSTVVLSYFSGAVFNTFVISSILLTAGLVFIAISGTFIYTAYDILCIYGLTALGSISSTLILMLFASFFKKSSTLTSFGVMVTAAIGFVIGAYIPVSQFSQSVQTFVNLVPGSQIAGMMRNALMNPAIDNINNALGRIDKGLFAENIKTSFTLNLNIFGSEVDFNFMMIYSLVAIAVFLLLNLVTYKLSSVSKE